MTEAGGDRLITTAEINSSEACREARSEVGR